MIFNNYEVPNHVPENEEFIYNLIEKMHWGGIDNGYLTGGLEALIEELKDENVSDELIQKTTELHNLATRILNLYAVECMDMVKKEYERLGKPLSLKAHFIQKERLDKEDDFKDKYCHR